MTTEISSVDLDQVLHVAEVLRRLTLRAVKVGVKASAFKQESWEAALEHVLGLHDGRDPVIRSDGALFRLLAFCPRPVWRFEHLDGIREQRVFDGRDGK